MFDVYCPHVPMLSCSISRFYKSWHVQRSSWQACVTEKEKERHVGKKSLLWSVPFPCILWSILNHAHLGAIVLAPLKFLPFLLSAFPFQWLCFSSLLHFSKPSLGPCGLLSYFLCSPSQSAVPSSLPLPFFFSSDVNLFPFPRFQVVLYACLPPLSFPCFSFSVCLLASLHFRLLIH